MSERLDSTEQERRPSRRKLLALAGAAALTWQLKEGISLSPPTLEVEPMIVNQTGEGVELIPIQSLEDDGSDSFIARTAEGRLAYDPSYGRADGFFVYGEEMKYVHRGGNGTAAIDESVAKIVAKSEHEGSARKGILDIDATVVDEETYGEHGIVRRFRIRFPGTDKSITLPIVLDINEKEIKFSMPSEYEALVGYIAECREKYNCELAVSVELKRGNFSPKVVYDMLKVNKEHAVPILIHSPEKEQIDFLERELAAT